jgi:hypothetical protein
MADRRSEHSLVLSSACLLFELPWIQIRIVGAAVGGGQGRGMDASESPFY